MLLMVLHGFMVAYINSSFLEQYIDSTSVGTIFTVGSALTIIIFLFISRVLRLVGSFNLTILLLILDFIAVVGMAYSETLRVAIPLFIVHFITLPLIIFNLDVFLEEVIGNNETATGSRRGLLLTLSALIGAAAPFIGSLFVSEATSSFTNAYLVSGLTLIPVLFILIASFKDFCDPQYDEIEVFAAIRSFWEQINIRYVFLAHFMLQVFFMFMVVYTPLYLVGEIGLTWKEFGIVMFFAQLAYVFFEYPVGLAADNYIGEREMMGFGFLIMILATSWMAFLTGTSILIWSLVMFTMRIGAAFAEVTTESYFFKQTKSSDAQVISFFRITRPLSYVLGALIGSLALLYLPFNLVFIVLAVIMVPALFCTLNIEDTL